LLQEKESICLGQVQIILKQNEVMTSIDKMNAVLNNLRYEVKISQISARDRGHIQDIYQISKNFERIPRGKFGTFLPSHQ
jgi:predicted solute-binding protein